MPMSTIEGKILVYKASPEGQDELYALIV